MHLPSYKILTFGIKTNRKHEYIENNLSEFPRVYLARLEEKTICYFVTQFVKGERFAKRVTTIIILGGILQSIVRERYHLTFSYYNSIITYYCCILVLNVM